MVIRHGKFQTAQLALDRTLTAISQVHTFETPHTLFMHRLPLRFIKDENKVESFLVLIKLFCYTPFSNVRSYRKLKNVTRKYDLCCKMSVTTCTILVLVAYWSFTFFYQFEPHETLGNFPNKGFGFPTELFWKVCWCWIIATTIFGTDDFALVIPERHLNPFSKP